jgi:hypothetical protein
MTWRLSYNHWPIVQLYKVINTTKLETHTIKDITYKILNNTENWITLTSIKTRGEIRCPIANTRVNHSKKAKLNIMHVTVNFLGLFFGPAKYFSVWQDFHVCQSEWLTTSQQVSGSLLSFWNTRRKVLKFYKFDEKRAITPRSVIRFTSKLQGR